MSIGAFVYSLRTNFYELWTLKLFKNFISVGIKTKFRFYPMKVVLKKNKSVITVYNQNHLQLLKYDQSVLWDNVTHSFRINTVDRSLIFFGAGNNSDLPGIFYLQEYDSLAVEGKIAIDIGANIGDSSIYFSTKKARKVFAVEPNNLSFQDLLKNIRANAMDDSIFPFNEALGSGAGFAKIANLTNTNGTLFDGIHAVSEPAKDSILVKDINRMISVTPDNDLILKMDCEGCEYNPIKCIENKNYKKIEQIFIEYHFGASELPKVLEKMGFSVLCTKGTISYVNGVIGTKRIMGRIIAKRGKP